MSARPTLSLVIPIYNEAEVLPELQRRLAAVLSDLERHVDSWEVVFVDDGSKDDSFEQLRAMAAPEPRFKVLSFSRNFGHQVAITAGLDHAEGDAVVVMDADLQDPPEVIAEMIAQWRAGFDVVYAIRKSRKGETIFKRATAAAFYRIFSALVGGASFPLDAGDFRLMARPAVLAMRALKEQHRFVRGMVSWVGFRQTAIHYDRDARFAGETKYPITKMVRFAVDGITSFSVFPLRLAIWLGVAAGFVAVFAGGWAIYEKFFGSGVVAGWTTIMMLIAFGASAQLLMMGIMGEYIGRIYEEVKRRPLYIEARQVNFSTAESPSRGPDEPGAGA
jgi:dolichol-phosphate mannosyltransferase